jgi:pyruvate-formate lyase
MIHCCEEHLDQGPVRSRTTMAIKNLLWVMFLTLANLNLGTLAVPAN